MKLAGLALFLTVALNCNAQFQIGSEAATSFSPNAVIGKYLDGIEEAATIFVYRDSDRDNLSQMKEVLTAAWTMNKLKFMSYDDFVNYEVKEGECYLTVSSNFLMVTGQGNSVSYLSDFALSFWRYSSDHAVFFSYTQLYVPLEANIMVMENGIESSDVIRKMYKEMDVRNWNLGYLKATFTDICASVKDGAARSCGEFIVNEDLGQLKSNTLYVSEDVLFELHRLRRKEDKKEDGQSLLESYEYPVELVTNEQINEKTASGEQSYCLTFVRNSLHKFIVVYETSTGKILYAKMESGFNFGKSDLQNLEKYIRKY